MPVDRARGPLADVRKLVWISGPSSVPWVPWVPVEKGSRLWAVATALAPTPSKDSARSLGQWWGPDPCHRLRQCKLWGEAPRSCLGWGPVAGVESALFPGSNNSVANRKLKTKLEEARDGGGWWPP